MGAWPFYNILDDPGRWIEIDRDGSALSFVLVKPLVPQQLRRRGSVSGIELHDLGDEGAVSGRDLLLRDPCERLPALLPHAVHDVHEEGQGLVAGDFDV